MQSYPGNDYDEKVHDFNVWDELFTQDDYESRVNEEADLMIALEALREAMIDLDYDIDRLEDHIDRNTHDIRDNTDHIRFNDDCIQDNGEEIEFQHHRVRRL